MVGLSFLGRSGEGRLRVPARVAPWAGDADRSAAASATRTRLLTLGAFCAVAGLWLATHIYQGVLLDSRVYLGRAMADLAPATIGQDLMFAHDGQAPFSAFTVLTRFLVAHFGLQTAATGLALTATGLWVLAAAAFVTRIAKGRLPWAMLACLAVLPSAYGGLLIIPFGEALAVPRPFAEAGVLAAFCAALDGRRLVALALLAVAGVFHPIMALCGFGVFFILTGWEDRRWIAPAVGLAVLAVVAGALGLPVASRLFQRIDPAWLHLLRTRNPYLFPGLWPLSTWSQSAVQVVTTLLAATLLQGRARVLFAGAAALAVVAVGLSWLMGDVWPNLLVLQVQPWRALWITAVFGAAGLALCAVKLLQGGRASQIALAALAVGWLFPESPAAPLAAALALVLSGLDRRAGGVAIGRPLVYLAWGLTAALALLHVIRTTTFAAQALATMPRSAYADVFLLSLHLQTLVVAPLVIWAATVRSERLAKIAPVLLPPLGAALLILGLLSWNRAPGDARPGGGPQPSLARLLAAKPGPVEWIDGDTQAWMLAGRANWASELQGASIVFSRDQAMLWRQRMKRLLSLGLVYPHILEPFAKGDGHITRPTAAALSALCRTPDRPAWIVSPVMQGEAAPNPPNTQIWRAPNPIYVYGGKFRWRTVVTYAVTRCDPPRA